MTEPQSTYTYIPRVPKCLSPRPNWDPPPPDPQASVFPPEPNKGGHTREWGGGGGGLSSDDRRKSLALCGSNLQMYDQFPFDLRDVAYWIWLNNLVWFQLDTCNVERGHGIPELEVLVVQTVGVVGPGSIRGRMDPPRACIIPFLYIRGLLCPCSVRTSLTQSESITIPGFPYNLLPVSCGDIDL